MEQQLGLSVEQVTEHSQNLFTKSEELNDTLTDILGKLTTMMEDGQIYHDESSSKNMYENIERCSSSVIKYVEGVQKFASFLVNETIATYETSDQEILELQAKLDESLADLETVNELGEGTIDSSQLDFSKISSNAGDAASGDFIQEGNVHKEYWEGELQLVPREDGTIQIVKDGTVMGYTTEEGINIPDETTSTEVNETTSSTTTESETSSSSTDEYFIQRGDSCTVYGENVKFYGRDGSYNYYTREDGSIVVDVEGGLQDLGTTDSTFNIGSLLDKNSWYGAVSTNNQKASDIGLPASDTIQSTNAAYDEYGMSELVDYGIPDKEQVTNVVYNESFKDAVLNHEKVIQVNNDIETPGWDLFSGSDIKTDNSGTVTLVFDERSNKYFQLGENGTYDRDMYGYTPEELAKYDIEVKRN